MTTMAGEAELAHLTRAPSQADAELIEGLLRNVDIPCLISKHWWMDHAAGGGIGGCDVSVRQADLERAREIVDAYVGLQ
jgi:hypothetical protein